MKPRNFKLALLSLISLLLTISCFTLGQIGTDTPTDHLLRFLHHIPDTKQYRQWVSYGDVSTWFDVWEVERPESGDFLELQKANSDISPMIWSMILGNQTCVPQSLGFEYSLTDDHLGQLGFNAIVLDRYMEAGYPPEIITVVEFSFDKDQIEDSLDGLEYQSEKMDEGTLYSIRDDYEMDFQSPLKTLQRPFLDRILLSDGKMIMGSATDIVMDAQDAFTDERRSLAENDDYLAVIQALEDKELRDLGEMVGVILMSGSTLNESLEYANQDFLSLQDEDFFQHPLPEFELAAFVTYQNENTSYLVLLLVFPKKVDAGKSADIVADRLKNYTSIATRQPLSENLSFEKSTAIDANDLPVAIVVMSTEAIEFQIADRNQLRVFTWREMILRQDLLFLKADSE
jgi:hypothetical protein